MAGKLPGVRKKPTIKEMASVIIELNQKLEFISHNLQRLDNVVGHYIEMNSDLEKFNEYLNKIREENDKKTNDESDNPNLQGDTDGEGSRSEGIRKEE